MFPFLVKETFLSWHGSFVGKHRKSLERNRLDFEDVNISINRMKSTFLWNLWSWVNLCIVERPRS